MVITRGDDMAFDKIETADLAGIGVIGLADTPQLSTGDMQAKFEETARSVIIPKFNKAMDELPEVRTGALDSFPRPGVEGKIYIDITVIPSLMYVWNPELEDYVLAGGAGSTGSAEGYDMTVTVPASGWSADAPHSQTVMAPGLGVNMAVVLAQVTLGAIATETEKEEYSFISGYEQGNGSVVFYASKRPSIDLKIRIFTGSSQSGGGGTGGTVSVEVESTTTGEPGSNAQVTNSGTDQNVKLNFVIPKGANGATGPQGPKGDTGATPNIQIGDVQTLEPGQQATASMTGTPENPLLNLRIPKGEKGDPGEDAESGSSATPRQEMTSSDTTVTLEPNKLYVFPEMASLTVTLGTPTDSNIANEYHFFFTSGDTATTLTLNDVLSDAYSIEANMKYEVSILEGVAYIKGVSISAET